MSKSSPITDVEKQSPGTIPSSEQTNAGVTTALCPTPDAPDIAEPPDGGTVAWSQVLAGHLANALTWGYAATFGVYQLHYEQTLVDLPSSQIAWIGSVQVFLNFALTTFAGRLADAGYARITVAAGTTLVVFGTFMTSLCKTYWQIMLAQGVCTGLGLGFCYLPVTAVLSSYFKKRRNLALAVAATGTATGSVLFPALVQYLEPKVGFPWAVRCASFAASLFAIVINVLLKPRLAPRRSGPLIEWQAFKERDYAFFAAGAFLFMYVLYFGFFYINTFARRVVGFSTEESVSLLLITNALGAPSRPFVGWVADRGVGPINVFIVALTVVAVVIFGWTGVHDRTGMYVFCVFLGLANGAAQGTFVGANASLAKDPRKMGIRFGMVTTLCGFAALAGPPTAGAIIDKSGGKFLGAQLWGGAVLLVALALVITSRVSAVGWKLRMRI